MPEVELVELKFRLYDGTDIGPVQYAAASTVAMLKERILSEWPRDKKVIPKTANDLRLISAGKILENNKTVAQCQMPFGELPGGVITMHVVVQPSMTKMKTGLSYLRRRSRNWPRSQCAHAPLCKRVGEPAVTTREVAPTVAPCPRHDIKRPGLPPHHPGMPAIPHTYGWSRRTVTILLFWCRRHV